MSLPDRTGPPKASPREASPDPSEIAPTMVPGRWTRRVRLPFFYVLTTLLIALALVAVLVYRCAGPRAERCPECQRKREDDHPICPCGWVYEYPETDQPLEYGSSSSEEVDP